MPVKKIRISKFLIFCSVILFETYKSLRDETHYWEQQLLVEGAVAEEARGEIDSHVGKMRLLMEKKLPQFFQLLHQYTVREYEDLPVLEADLDGWWAVASIQVGYKTIQRFNNKVEMQLNSTVTFISL